MARKEQRLRAMRETWLSVFSDSGWRDDENVWHTASPFTATEHHVALTLATYMSANGDSCFPSIPRLAAGSGRSDSTVRDALNKLVEWGFLDRVRRRGRGHSNEYVARIPGYFDWHADGEENRRRAAVFASGHEQLLVGPAVKPVPETGSEAPEKTAGERRFSQAGEGPENRRSDSSKPPEGLAKTAGDRPQLVQEVSNEKRTPLPPADAGGEELSPDGFRYQVELALSAELEPGQLTRSAKRQWENAISQLLDVGATAEDVQARCAVYRQTYPTAPLTPLALVRHWPFLGGKVELERSGFNVERWVEKTGWSLPEDLAREVLFGRDLPAEEIERHLARCAELRGDNHAAEQVAEELFDQARRIA